MPIVQLLRHDLDLETLHENGKRKDLLKRNSRGTSLDGTAKRVLEITGMVCDLDQRGLRLEATLLCMYHGMLPKTLIEFDPEIRRLEIMGSP